MHAQGRVQPTGEDPFQRSRLASIDHRQADRLLNFHRAGQQLSKPSLHATAAAASAQTLYKLRVFMQPGIGVEPGPQLECDDQAAESDPGQYIRRAAVAGPRGPYQ
jgi:hypothetical protein